MTHTPGLEYMFACNRATHQDVTHALEFAGAFPMPDMIRGWLTRVHHLSRRDKRTPVNS